jgi:hypothetical protein
VIRVLCWALTVPLVFALVCVGMAVLLRDLWRRRAR